MSSKIEISVIIPTYNDWNRLSKCINALQNQTVSKDTFEIIIINNAPLTPPPPKLLIPSNTYIIEEASPGSYAARNAGIKMAKGNILAFTDSDCIPHDNWLENAKNEITKGAKRVGGKISLFSQVSGQPNLAELYELTKDPFPQKDFVENTGFAATANMITLKENFDRVGLFNANLMSGGDAEWGIRATQNQIPIIFSEKVVVSHPARNKISLLIAKQRRIAAGAIYVNNKFNKQHVLSKIIIGLIPPLLFYRQLISNQSLSQKSKLKLFFLRYIIKLLTTLEILLLILKIKKSRRE